MFLRHLRAKIGNDHVVAREYAVCRANLAGFARLHIGDLYFLGTLPIADMLHSHGGAVQTNADHGGGIIEPGVIHVGSNNVFHGIARSGAGNQRAHQQPRDGSVSVGKVKNVRLFFRFLSVTPSRGHLHALKSGVAHAPAISRRYGVNSHTEEIVR